MKPLKFIPASLLLPACCLPAHAEMKAFIRVCTGQTSYLDSEMSGRTIALGEAKRFLLAEVDASLISETGAGR
ncbi:MAG: hypothetical protein K4571_08995 [Deltaproteobacteria bacterium]